MAVNDLPSDGAGLAWQPMRREHDRIAQVEQLVRMALLSGASDAGERELSFEAAVRYTMMQLAQVMEESVVEVWLRDVPPWGAGDGESLAPIASATRAGEVARTTPDDLILAVMTASRPLRFDDAPEHPLVRTWVTGAEVSPEVVNVFLGLPVRYRREMIGVLAIAIPYTPSVEHVALLDSIADYLGVAAQVAHATYLEEHQHDVSFAVLREAPLAAAVVTPGDYTLIITNPRFDHLLHIGPDVWGQRLDVALPEHAAALRKAWRLDEVSRTGTLRVMLDMPVRLLEGLTYWDFTCAPLLDGPTGTVQGIVITGVDVTARVVQRQRQQRSVDVAQERVWQMVALHQISLEVATQLGQDPMALLRQILEKMAQVVDASGGMVYYADRETGDLEAIVATGLSKNYTGTRLARGEGLSGRVFITGQGQLVADYRRYPLRASAFAEAPFGAVAAVPMKQRGQVVGVICLVQELRLDGTPIHHHHLDDTQTAFTAEDIWLLELFATQAAHAIENARTYLDLERAYQRQRALDRQRDDFLARASHDLRLPLTSVVGYLDLALARVEGDDDLQTLLQQAADEAQRLREMLDDMMAQVRQDGQGREPQTRPLDLGPIIEDVVQARRKQVALHGTRHRFFLQIDEPLTVLADRTSLKEVLENLISNAVKYSPGGGDIVIAARATVAQDDAQGEMALVTVSDEGIGIPPEAHDQIFERFLRLESSLASEIRGDGIGLYLARQLVEAMGGTIWLAQSQPGVGSIFAFTLPLAPESVAFDHADPPPVADAE